ncbi:MAG: FtsX-like permease family protein, partial [bacterium]|nr:FtsX-like permease family protein [bacterium]
MIGHLQEGVTKAQAEADLRRIALALTSEHPSNFPHPEGDPSLHDFDVLELRSAIVGRQRSLLWLLLGGVGLLLLIACANTAQLLLARSLRRTREIAVRSALGASRLRLIRQFLLEGVILAGCGGVVGLLAAGGIARILVGLLPQRSPLLASAQFDLRVIGFTLAISLASAILFSIIPAVKGSRWTPGPSLTSRVTTGDGNRWRHMMIAIEAGLSVFLLCGAGLVVQNLWALIATPMGFDPNDVLAMRLKLPSLERDMPDPTAGPMLERYLEKVAAIPGVESAATVSGPPLRPARGGPMFPLGTAEGGGEPRRGVVWVHQISPDYFRTLRIPLLAGRAFRASDAGERVSVAIVNEEYARRFGLGSDVIGKQILDPSRPITIVGMVGNVRARGRETTVFPEVYYSSLEFSWPNVYLVVRSKLPPAQLVSQVRA